MAPEGCVMDVQLAICYSAAARARKPPRNHTGRTAFPKCQGPGQRSLPPGAPHPSQTLSFRWSQWGSKKTSLTGVTNPCGAFVGLQNEITRVEANHSMAHSSAKDHYSSLSGAKSSGYSTALQTGSPLPDHVTVGLSTGPEETHWHSTAGVML
ncbi:unnamed protein product [Pleuronectes platessa]|uniref:Uncharacterized protein n=1 Tax=Pleuronectes platessa TaxID=8262 RepID=A0A9N7UGQ3_PLEPL|nr:unnamed protein product [Pleuronectes platessa]